MQSKTQLNSVMEPKAIQKSEASLKSRKSKEKFYLIICFSILLLSFSSCFSTSTFYPATSLTNVSMQSKECKESIASAMSRLSSKKGGYIPLSADDIYVDYLLKLPSGQGLSYNGYRYLIVKKKGKPYLSLSTANSNLLGLEELKNCNCN